MIREDTDQKVLEALEFQPPCEWQTTKMPAPCAAPSGWILTLGCCGQQTLVCTEHMATMCKIFRQWRRSLLCGKCFVTVADWHWQPIGGER